MQLELASKVKFLESLVVGSGGANSLDVLNSMWTPEMGQSALDGASASKLIREAEEKRISKWRAAQRREIASIWAECDEDGNGFLDSAELRGVLKRMGHDCNSRGLEIILREIDEDGDGRIDEGEFFEWWCTRSVADRERMKSPTFKARSKRIDILLSKLKVAARLSGALKRNSARMNTLGFAQLVKGFRVGNKDGMTAPVAMQFDKLLNKVSDLEEKLILATEREQESEGLLARLRISAKADLVAAAEAHRQTEAQHAATVRRIGAEHEQAVAALNADKISALAVLKDRLECSIATMQEDAQSKLQELQSAHTLELRELKSECDAATRASIEEAAHMHSSMLSLVKQRMQETVEQTKENYSATLEQESAEHETQISLAVAQHETVVQSLTAAASAQTKTFNELRGLHSEALSAVQLDHQECNARAESDRKLQHERSEERYQNTVLEHNNAMVAMVTQHEETCALVAELNKEKDIELAEVRGTLQAEHQAHMKHQKMLQEKQSAARLAEQQADYEISLSKHEHRLAATVTKYEETCSSLSAKHADQIQAHEATLMTTVEDHEQARRVLVASHEDQISAHRETLHTATKQHAEARRSLASSHAAQIAAHEATLATTVAQHEETCRSLALSHAEHVEAVTLAASERTRHVLEQKHRHVLAQQKIEHEHALAHMKQHAIAQVAQAREEMQRSLDAQHAELLASRLAQAQEAAAREMRAASEEQSSAASQILAQVQAKCDAQTVELAQAQAKAESLELLVADLQAESQDRQELANMLVHKIQVCHTHQSCSLFPVRQVCF